jgi:hypothetical protein
MRRLTVIALAVAACSSPRPSKTLLVGDSHTLMTFGASLASELGPNVERYAVSSSAASDWLRGSICPAGEPCPFTYGYATPAGESIDPVPPSLHGVETLLAETDATTVIIALGTNDGDQRCLLPASQDVQPIAELVALVSSRTCYWVGPPRYRRGPVYDACGERFDTFTSRMAQVITTGGCRFIDSRQILDPSTGRPIEADLGDELHFGARLGHAWATSVARQISKPNPALP